MSITENSQATNLHSDFLRDDIGEGYIKSRHATTYDNESNKELILGNVDETRSLSPTTNSDVSQNDSESSINVLKDQPNTNYDNLTSGLEKESNLSNNSDVPNTLNSFSDNNGQTILINNVHENNSKTEEEQDEIILRKDNELSQNTENKVIIPQNNNKEA